MLILESFEMPRGSTRSLKYVLTTAALFICLSSYGDASVVNVLVNPGFESPTTGGIDAPGAFGWTPFSDGVRGSTAGMFTTDELSFMGENSLRTFKSGFPNAGGMFQSFAASEGEVWTGSVWALNHISDPLTGSRSGAIGIVWIDQFGGQLRVDATQVVTANSPTGDSANDYIFGEVSGTAPAGTVAAEFNLLNGHFNGDGKGLVYFDNASFGTVAAVPEPSTFALGLLGLASYALRRRWS